MKKYIALFIILLIVLNVGTVSVVYGNQNNPLDTRANPTPYVEDDDDDDSNWYDSLTSFLTNIINSLKNIKNGVDNIQNNIVQYIMDALVDFPLALAETLLDVVVNPLAAAVPQFLLETVEFENIAIVNTIWKASLAIGLVILTILTAIGMGFGGNPAFKYDNFGMPEHIFVRMFYTLALMTASKTIAVHIYNIAGWMTNYVFSETAMAISTSWNIADGSITGIMKLVLFGIFLLPSLVLNIFIYVILIIRVLDLMMLTCLGPISASTFVLPNTKFIALNHLKEYIAVVLVQFILVVVLALWTGLATFMDGLVLQFTKDFAMQGVAKVVGQGIMMIVLTIYTLTRPGWLKRLLGVGSSSSVGGLLQLARMFI